MTLLLHAQGQDPLVVMTPSFSQQELDILLVTLNHDDLLGLPPPPPPTRELARLLG